MLVDTVTITIKAGDGGSGVAHFRRNAQTARGGPDGGNGGDGGNVYIQGIDDILGLAQFRFKKMLAAENGIKGGKQNLFGRNGKDLLIKIPLGTTVTDLTTQEVFEITNTTERICIAKGGIGGRGNNEFKTATNQAPRFAEKGTPGQERKVQLTLRLIADVGLVGLPNAGKSSLLKALTHASPKIGNYPFTTLEPNIGMLGAIALADIPGLIEGASAGKGLGIQFLQHVEKTTLLLHCIDITNPDIVGSYKTVRKELEKYNETINKKPEFILLTKTDMLSEEMIKQIQKETEKALHTHVLTVSILDDESLDKLISLLRKKADHNQAH